MRYHRARSPGARGRAWQTFRKMICDPAIQVPAFFWVQESFPFGDSFPSRCRCQYLRTSIGVRILESSSAHPALFFPTFSPGYYCMQLTRGRDQAMQILYSSVARPKSRGKPPARRKHKRSHQVIRIDSAVGINGFSYLELEISTSP